MNPRLRPHRMPQRVARAVGLFLGGLVWGTVCLGCERRAPGPKECLEFADVWMSAERRGQGSPLGVQNVWDELVVRCLTEPYDRELVSCVASGAPRERCRIDYVRRLEAQR